MNLRGRLGRRGEHLAGRHLQRLGGRIVARNYRCPQGEIDLIVLLGDTLVFVEVKTRTAGDGGQPEEPVQWTQRRRIERAARYFVRQHHLEHRPCRFDVVCVFWPQGGRPVLEHFENAFPVVSS
ncbi:MAG TPA: YraN family protein [Phycisphaerae bacterium]|nr:YraN family protein [Phycisphaerae bacterium]HNU43692.1 YraN family protein [Phycisphaerae bacterium]